jgi:hypothetical protein
MSSKTLTKYRKVIAKIQFSHCNMTQSFPFDLKQKCNSIRGTFSHRDKQFLNFETENINKIWEVIRLVDQEER